MRLAGLCLRHRRGGLQSSQAFVLDSLISQPALLTPREKCHNVPSPGPRGIGARLAAKSIRPGKLLPGIWNKLLKIF